MAPTSPHCAGTLDSGCCEKNLSTIEDEDAATSDSSIQAKASKHPRNGEDEDAETWDNSNQARTTKPPRSGEDEDAETCDNSNQVKVTKPPRNGAIRHSMSHILLGGIDESGCPATGVTGSKSPDQSSKFLPACRSGCCSEIGPKTFMEDEYICVDNLLEHLSATSDFPSPGAFYGVFDGHGGVDAASFTRKNLLNFITQDSHFPSGVKRAIKNAFVRADHALADSLSLDRSSGTTALTAFILGRTLLIANAGDSRAVLGKRGRAIELSKDHKPNCTSEKIRIEKLGGTVYDGYLNGQLSVARALGDWHMKGSKGSSHPLSSEPELAELILTEEDEFLIMGCDGLWDVMSSQYAVTIVRRELMLHNDPEKCSKLLVKEALKRNTCDNLTVLVVCFSQDPPPRIEVPKTHRRRSISAEGLDLLKGVLNNS
ncbi:Phosphoprotein phosphatase [Bertholletia excelsa]